MRTLEDAKKAVMPLFEDFGYSNVVGYMNKEYVRQYIDFMRTNKKIFSEDAFGVPLVAVGCSLIAHLMGWGIRVYNLSEMVRLSKAKDEDWYPLVCDPELLVVLIGETDMERASAAQQAFFNNVLGDVFSLRKGHTVFALQGAGMNDTLQIKSTLQKLVVPKVGGPKFQKLPTVTGANFNRKAGE